MQEAARSLEQKRTAERNKDKLFLKDAPIAELSEVLVKRINEMPYHEIRILRNRDREESRELVAVLEDLAARLEGLLDDVAE